MLNVDLHLDITLCCWVGGESVALDVPRGGHYTYRTVVWSLHVPRSGHYTYRTVVWSLHVPRSGHYTYRTVVTTRTARWSLYAPPGGHYMYRQFNRQQIYVLPTQCIYVFCVDLRTNSDYFPIQH